MKEKVMTMKRRMILFAGIIVVLIVIALAVGCRSQSIPMEEEKSQIEETTPPTTQETTPIVTQTPETTTQETPVVVEEEIINAPEIEGLIFEQETRTYITEAGNPYALPEGEVVGVYVEEAALYDGKEEDFIGLKPPVIEGIQKDVFSEKEEYYIPIPFDLNETKGIRIRKLKSYSNLVPDSDKLNLGMNVPIDSIFYANLSGDWYSAPVVSENETEDKIFDSILSLDDLFPESRFAGILCVLFFSDGEIIADVKDTIMAEELPVNCYNLKIGDPLAKILSEKTLDITANRVFSSQYPYSFEDPGEYQFYLEAWSNYKEGKMKAAKIFEIEGIKVFILP